VLGLCFFALVKGGGCFENQNNDLKQKKGERAVPNSLWNIRHEHERVRVRVNPREVAWWLTHPNPHPDPNPGVAAARRSGKGI